MLKTFPVATRLHALRGYRRLAAMLIAGPLISAFMARAHTLLGADPPPTTLKEALAGMAKSLEAMRGYDVYMTVTAEWPYKDVMVDVKDPEHPTRTKKMELRPWDPGEVPLKRVATFRQAVSRSDQQRIEEDEYYSNSPPRKGLQVDDGKTMRALNGKQGSIQKTRGSLREGADSYGTYLGGLLFCTPLEKVIENRLETRLMENQENADLIGILLPDTKRQSWWPDFEYRVWLDRKHGLLPKKVETYRKQSTETTLWSVMEVTRFSEAKPGVWAPVAMTHTAFQIGQGQYRGQAIHVVHAAVDSDRSRWGVDLDDDLFLLPFPPDVQVIDLMNNFMFTTGHGDDGKDIKHLMAYAINPIPINTGDQHRESLNLAKVRQQDRDAAIALLKYEAELETNAEGAIISVAVKVDARFHGAGGANMDDAGLAYVGKLVDLEELHLSKTQVTDRGLVHLKDLKHLKTLILSNTKITDEGLKHLAGLTDLKRLDLDNYVYRDGKPIRTVLITDEGLAELASLKNLELLSLRGCLKGTGFITDEGVAKLKAAVPKSKVVR
jgi:hypothetical protein